jgi:penicillin-binding protein 2
MGLTEGTITTDTVIECEGIYKYYSGYQPRCWIYNSYGSFNGHFRKHGPITVREAIQDSCNCFYYELGRLVGIDTMNAYSKIFGLGEKTGIEIGESKGIVAGNAYRDENGLAPWEPGDTIAAAIGQSDNSFTPIQLSTMVSTVVTGTAFISALACACSYASPRSSKQSLISCTWTGSARLPH